MRMFSQISLHGVVLVLSISFDVADLYAGNSSSSGRSIYRILVEVPAVELPDRDGDVSVASVPIDFPLLLEQQRLSGQFVPSSLHIHRYDSVSSRALQFEDGRFAADPHDCRCRFDDELSPGSDLNGDADILIQSAFFSFLAERSFFEHGYRPASFISDEDPKAPIQIGSQI